MVDNFLSHSYNIELAKKYGVKASILLSYVFSVRTATLSDKEVLLNREQIRNATGLSASEQKEAEDILYQNHILTLKQFTGKADGNYYIINPLQIVERDDSQNISNMFLPKAMEVAEQESHVSKEDLKRESIKRNLKNSIQISDESLRQYVYMWIDTIYEKPNGFLSKTAVELAMQDLSNFSTDVSTRVEILKIAIKLGYKDIKWAINSYQRTNKDAQIYRWQPYVETRAERIQTENGAF